MPSSSSSSSSSSPIWNTERKKKEKDKWSQNPIWENTIFVKFKNPKKLAKENDHEDLQDFSFCIEHEEFGPVDWERGREKIQPSEGCLISGWNFVFVFFFFII